MDQLSEAGGATSADADAADIVVIAIVCWFLMAVYSLGMCEFTIS